MSGKYHGHGTIIKEYKSLKPSKNMCSGCYNEIYQYGHLGVKKCWSFTDAKVVDKEAYSSIHATSTSKYKKTLSCYHG